MLVHGIGAVGVRRAERPLLHLLEADGEDAVGQAPFDELPGHEERRRARRAVVVDVVDGDAGESELVDGPLAAGRLPVDVPNAGLLDGLVGDHRVLEGLRDGLLHHVGVVPLAGLGLLELRHANADDEHAASHPSLLWP